MDNLQKKAIRRIEYCPIKENRSDYSVLQVKYNIEDLRLRRKRSLVKIMYAQTPSLKANVENNCNLELRSSKKANRKTDFTDKTRVYNSPHYRGTRLWNLLPSDIQKEKNKLVFKKKIQKHVF